MNRRSFLKNGQQQAPVFLRHGQPAEQVEDHFRDMTPVGLVHESPRFQNLEDAADAVVLFGPRERTSPLASDGSGGRELKKREERQKDGRGQIIRGLPRWPGES